MRWDAFLGATIFITILVFIQWPKIKKYSKKEKVVFFTLLFIGWGLSMFDLPNIAGPVTVLNALFKPFSSFMEL